MKLPQDREQLIEAVASAWRSAVDGAVRVHPSWYDLDESGREEAFEAARLLRRLEAALDPDGLSTTARAVLDRITRA
jgi:hypothetical protein